MVKMMVKEFCIQYRIYYDGEKQYNDDSVTIKIKTGDEISEKERVFCGFGISPQQLRFGHIEQLIVPL